MKKRTISR